MNKAFVISALLAAVATNGLAGTITEFTSRPLFDAAVGSTTTETFGANDCFPLTGPLSASSSYGCLPVGTILPGATYSSPIVAGNAFNIDSGGGSFPTQFLDSLLLGRTSAPLTVTFATPTIAVGFDTSETFMGSTFSILFNFTSGSTLLTPSVSGGSSLSFFGFKSSAADIQSVVITGSTTDFGFALDDFSFTAPSSSVPEPGTFSLLSAALLLGVGVRKLRSRASPQV